LAQLCNIIELNGSILDISFKADTRKARLADIKCVLKICDSSVCRVYPDNIEKKMRQLLCALYDKIDQQLKDSIQTVYVTMFDNTIGDDTTLDMTSNNDGYSEFEYEIKEIEKFRSTAFDKFHMFERIRYKMCGLVSDIKKISTYL
jgi:hypothetical protein